MPLSAHTSIPFGNAVITRVDSAAGEVDFMPSPHGGPETLWFCFRVQNDDGPGGGRPGRPLTLRLLNVHNMLGGHHPEFMRPVVRSVGGDWSRLGAPDIAPHGDGRYDAIWRIPRPESAVDVAFCYPYGPGDVAMLLQGPLRGWKADTIGLSQGSQPLVRLSNTYGSSAADRPGIFAIARQHSGETPGSWAMHGFLMEMAQMGPAAPIVWAVPLSNIDGVIQGDYGKDNFPWDLNRAWEKPPMRHETLVYRQDIERFRMGCKPQLIVDFHSPGACERDGVYTFLADPEKDRESYNAAYPWSEAVRMALGEHAARDFARVANYPSRFGQLPLTKWCWGGLAIAGLALEIPYAMIGGLVLGREHYIEIGRRVARGLARRLLEPS